MSGETPNVAALRVRLREGMKAGEEVGAVRDALGLDEGVAEFEVAQKLVSLVGQTELDMVAIAGDRRIDPRPVRDAVVIGGADTSFLGQLRTGDGQGGGLDIARLEEPRTVVAICRAGTLRQRRAAVRRMGQLVSDDRRQMSGDMRKLVTDVLAKLRDVELAYELSTTRAHLSGAAGREARDDREQFERLASTVGRRVRRFWDGDLADEPITLLPGDQRALLLMRVQDLGGPVAEHIAAVVESPDVLTRDERLSLLSSLRFAGDPRLVPALVAVLEGSDPELALEAAQALGRMDDPRVHGALRFAYERNVVVRHRTVLAGALGYAGDARGADYVRQNLDNDDPETVRAALEALEAVGGAEDTDLVVRVISGGDASLVVQALRALARIADGRALPALSELRDQTSVSALWAEMEDTSAAIRARMDLKGEEQGEAVLPVRSSEEEVALARATPTGMKLRGFKDYVIGRIWLFLGVSRRAVARFERAAVARTSWCTPLVAIAMVHVRKERYAQALASFRRAIEVDRQRIERTPTIVRALVSSFLRRADEVERDGRVDVARGLLDEARSLDLRRAPGPLRFEISRRYDNLRRRGR